MKTRNHSVRSLSGTALLLTATTLPLHARPTTYSFGSGVDSFTMDFVTVGNPGNAPDNTGKPNPAGSVSYAFQMGKYEVSEDMITKASTSGNLGIAMQVTRGGSKPATYVTWNEAARFVNWLNTSLGYVPAYKFTLQPGEAGYSANGNIALWAPGDGGYDALNPYRNNLAHFFLPSENEWYKAAYYDGTTGVYYDYPTGGNTAPTGVSGGTAAGTVVGGLQGGPADITNAGGVSPYGTMAQGGNAREWMESAYDGFNDSATEVRTHRGAYWGRNGSETAASRRELPNPGVETGDNCNYPTYERYSIGFRVAAVPEPAEYAVVIGTAALGFALWRRRGSV